jgi:hypothetical protein
VATAGLGLLGATIVVTTAPRVQASTASPVSSALPDGWELCILQGVNGHASHANLSDLDVWQAAEGGATDNGLAYNPFNTRRGTDPSGVSLPASYTASGFPVFASWPAGCAATVATILQPNMAAIAGALHSGSLSPPTAFLSTVGQTPWCAPSDAGSCYSDLITGGAAAPPSKAPTLLRHAADALTAYNLAVSAETTRQAALASERRQLETADIEVDLARLALQHATDVLRALAVYDYTSNPSIDHMTALLSQFHPPSESDLLSQYYVGLDSSTEIRRFQAGQALLARTESTRTAATGAVDGASAALDAATTLTRHALSVLEARLDTLRVSGACTAPASGAQNSDLMTVTILRTCLSALGALGT